MVSSRTSSPRYRDSSSCSLSLAIQVSPTRAKLSILGRSVASSVCDTFSKEVYAKPATDCELRLS